MSVYSLYAEEDNNKERKKNNSVIKMNNTVQHYKRRLLCNNYHKQSQQEDIIKVIQYMIGMHLLPYIIQTNNMGKHMALMSIIKEYSFKLYILLPHLQYITLNPKK